MSKIRFGKDIQGTWPILTNGAATSLVGRDLTLLLKFPCGKSLKLEHSIQDTNKVVFKFFGTEHEDLGTHSLSLWENLGKVGQTCVDKLDAFTLVATTEEEDSASNSSLTTSSVTLSGSNMVTGIPGIGIENITQIVTTEVPGAQNKVRITLTDGKTFDYVVYNGKDYVLTNDDKDDIADIAKDKLGATLFPKQYGTLAITYTNGGYYGQDDDGSFATIEGTGKYAKVDVSQYIGKAIKVTINSAGYNSTRFSAIGNEDASTIDKYEKEVDMSNGAKFIPTSECHYLYVSAHPDSTIKATVVDIVDTSIFSSLNKTMYVSPTGSDSNDGITMTKAVATVTCALANGATNILLASGTYKETIDLQYAKGKNIVISKAEPKGEVIFTNGTARIIAESAIKVNGYNNIYSAPNTRNIRLSTGRKLIFQEGIADVSTVISSSETHPLQRGRKYRCEKETKIECCTSNNLSDALAEINSAIDYKYWWDETNGVVYFSCPSAPSATKPICSDFGKKLFINADNTISVKVVGIECNYVCFNVDYLSNAEIIDCSSRNVCDAGAFTYNFCENVKFVRCEASRAFCSTNGVNGDGFNGHCENNDTIVKDRMTCTLIDCWSHDNSDDGYSDHERAETSLYGGLYEYNGKAGVTPSYGSHCSCYNVYSRCNYEGFMYIGEGTYDGGESGSLICYDCVAENNNRGSGDSVRHSGYRVASDSKNHVKLVNCVSINNAIGIKCDLGSVVAYNASIINCTTKTDGNVSLLGGGGGSGVSSYNELTDKPTIPSKTSDLTNDSNFVADSNYVHTDNNFTNDDKTAVGKIDELSLKVQQLEQSGTSGGSMNVSGVKSALLSLEAILKKAVYVDDESSAIASFKTLVDAITETSSGGSTTPTSVSTPTLSANGTTLTASCATSGATIYYTTNGSTPTSSSTKYTSAITMTNGTTYKFIAVKDGVSSSVASHTYQVTSYSITKNLSNCSINNSATTINQGSSYFATISANSGYTLGSVQVTMGGVSQSVTNGVVNISNVTGNIVITASATASETTPTSYTITKNLTNCTINNSASSINEGGAYSATITPNSGYELETINVTMGGQSVEVSSGVINIASVSGNIVISANATQQGTDVAKLSVDVGNYYWDVLDNKARRVSNSSYYSPINAIVCNGGDEFIIDNLQTSSLYGVLFKKDNTAVNLSVNDFVKISDNKYKYVVPQDGCYVVFNSKMSNLEIYSNTSANDIDAEENIYNGNISNGYWNQGVRTANSSYYSPESMINVSEGQKIIWKNIGGPNIWGCVKYSDGTIENLSNNKFQQVGYSNITMYMYIPSNVVQIVVQGKQSDLTIYIK